MLLLGRLNRASPGGANPRHRYVGIDARLDQEPRRYHACAAEAAAAVDDDAFAGVEIGPKSLAGAWPLRFEFRTGDAHVADRANAAI
jgi:hypothetical protein